MAAHILERLIAASGTQFRVVAIVTRPDEPRGRGLSRQPSEVAAVGERFSLPVLKPAKVRTAEFLAELASFAPDLLVVAAYGRLLPKAVLDVARIMPINVHASLLPRHRGAAPVEGAILAGDPETGVSIMRMTERMDAGAILLQRAIPIAPDETQGTLKDKLAELGAAALLDALELIASGRAVETPQDDSRATYTSPVKKEDAIIDWSADAARIERMTRAFDPWPVVRTTLDGTPLMVWRAAVVGDETAAAPPGTIVTLKPNPVVQCGRGRLELIEVQAAGRKRMSGADFARGRRLAAGQRLGA